jgi:tRNA C32,U32 (ribose-2'-O)-methylase TrmJ
VKKKRWYYAEKRGRMFAFDCARERDYWVVNSHATAMSNYQVMARYTKTQREAIHAEWPNRNHDTDSLIEHYLQELDKLQAQFDKIKRKRQLLRKVVEHKTGCKYKKA